MIYLYVISWFNLLNHNLGQIQILSLIPFYKSKLNFYFCMSTFITALTLETVPEHYKVLSCALVEVSKILSFLIFPYLAR